MLAKERARADAKTQELKLKAKAQVAREQVYAKEKADKYKKEKKAFEQRKLERHQQRKRQYGGGGGNPGNGGDDEDDTEDDNDPDKPKDTYYSNDEFRFRKPGDFDTSVTISHLRHQTTHLRILKRNTQKQSLRSTRQARRRGRRRRTSSSHPGLRRQDGRTGILQQCMRSQPPVHSLRKPGDGPAKSARKTIHSKSSDTREGFLTWMESSVPN